MGTEQGPKSYFMFCLDIQVTECHRKSGGTQILYRVSKYAAVASGKNEGGKLLLVFLKKSETTTTKFTPSSLHQRNCSKTMKSKLLEIVMGDI